MVTGKDYWHEAMCSNKFTDDVSNAAIVPFCLTKGLWYLTFKKYLNILSYPWKLLPTDKVLRLFSKWRYHTNIGIIVVDIR